MSSLLSKVKIVNPDISEAIAISKIVKSDGVDCVQSSSALDVLTSIQKSGAPDLIITDLHMVDVDGWRFCHLLRSKEFKEANETPVIITSSIFLDADLADIARNLGADMYFSLPCDEEEMRLAANKLLKEGSCHKNPVALVVEDDVNSSELISSSLSENGYEVVNVETGVDACSKLKSIKPDVVIIEHSLSNADVFELLDDLRGADLKSGSIIIVMTDESDPELAITYIKKGIHGYVRKPFTGNYLIDLINKAERSRALQRVEELLNLRTSSLREAEKRFRDLYEDAPLGYHTLDSEGLILSMNETELAWLGYRADEIIGKKTIFDIQTTASASKGEAIFDELKKQGYLKDIELEHVRKDGSAMPVVIQSKAVTDSNGNFVMCRTIVRDITERKRLEAQLRHAQKMESLGIMAEGIAHNFNNLLTPVLVNASYLLEGGDVDDEKREILGDIIDSARRGSGLVKQLTSLGRFSDKRYDSIDLVKVVEETLGILRETLDKSVRIDVNVDISKAMVIGNDGQLQQAILNLCFNARDAMPDGGVVTVSLVVNRVMSEDTHISVNAKEGTYFVLSIADTGTGMTGDIQEKIFDPFFTTKGLAKGTGLGLSTTYAIVNDHDGFLHVYSEPGEGSRFSMYFPVHDSTQEGIADQLELAPLKELTSKGGKKGKQGKTGKCILVIDDEKDILSSTSRMLRRSGYDVIEAVDGLAGLNALRASCLNERSVNSTGYNEGFEVDLVILDVVMPGMSGEKVLQRLRAISSDVPVIVASGYGHVSRVTDFLKNGAQNIIAKPFDRAELLAKVSETLDMKQGSQL